MSKSAPGELGADLGSTAQNTNWATVIRLSLMMFLQYAVWGAWLPLAGRFLKAGTDVGGLGFDDTQIGYILGVAASLGAIASPFIAGQVADRYFRTERCLSFLLIAGGITQWILAEQSSYQAWFWLTIIYSLLFMPTLALSNSLAFAHIKDADRDFPLIRVWGTIGWIAASWIFPMIWLQTNLKLTAIPPFLVGQEVENVTARLVGSLQFSAIIAWFYAVYCFTLPATPPKKDGVEPLAFVKAFRQFCQPTLLVLLLASLIVSSIHQVYFLQTSPFFAHLGIQDSSIGPAMTIGQFAEIFVMALLGFFLKSLGFKRVLIIGASAYVARYGIWGTTSLPVEVIVISQILHGVCYACFFAASFIYVDRVVPVDVRHSAQTVYGIMILGGGPILGGKLNGWLGETFLNNGLEPPSYTGFWWTLAGIGAATMLILLISFQDKTRKQKSIDTIEV